MYCPIYSTIQDKSILKRLFPTQITSYISPRDYLRKQSIYLLTSKKNFNMLGSSVRIHGTPMI